MIKKILDFLSQFFIYSCIDPTPYPHLKTSRIRILALYFKGKHPLEKGEKGKRKQQCSLEHPTLANPAYDSKAAG